MSEPRFKKGDRVRLIQQHPAHNPPAHIGDIATLGEPYYMPFYKFNGWFLEGCGTLYFWQEDWMERLENQERPKKGFGKWISHHDTKV